MSVAKRGGGGQRSRGDPENTIENRLKFSKLEPNRLMSHMRRRRDVATVITRRTILYNTALSPFLDEKDERDKSTRSKTNK